MQIVINISERIYDKIMDDVMPTEGEIDAIVTRIYQGTPLPKGHGRLIDADKLERYMLADEKQDKKTWFLHSAEYKSAVPIFNHALMLVRDHAPTIIEADKEGVAKRDG